METKARKNLILGCIADAAVIAVSVLAVQLSGHKEYAHLAVLADVFFVLAVAILIMADALDRSWRESLYSYTNIGLVGGILFAAVLACVMAFYFLRALCSGELSVNYIFSTIVGFPRKFSYWAVFVIFAVSLALGVSNIALIRHEGFCLNNALSLLVAGFYIGGTLLVYYISDVLLDRLLLNGTPNEILLGIHTAVSLFLVLMLCYFECILAGSAIMGWAAAKTIPAYDKDYVIILGCSIDRRGGLLPLLKGRVNRAIRFAWEQEIATGKPMKYVPSGGQGANEVMSEGSAMELYLMSRGAEDYEILPEKKSTSTWENMCFSKEIIDGVKPGAKVAFATTNYHILRSGILARQAGLDAEGIAGDTKWYFWPNGFVREFFAILAMNVKAHIYVAAVVASASIAAACAGCFLI